MVFVEEEGGRERVGALVAGMQREYELSTLKAPMRRKLPWMVVFVFFFLARVNAVTESICDSSAFYINQTFSECFLLNTSFFN